MPRAAYPAWVTLPCTLFVAVLVPVYWYHYGPGNFLWFSVDFAAGGNLVAIADYMFDGERPLYLRGLSLFHLFLPPLLIWMLVRQGYDRRALVAQTVLTVVILPASFLLTEPQDNVNWVHGIGEPPEPILPPLVHLGLQMVVIPLVVILPMHLLLVRAAGSASRARR